jgi:hypothetical protein
MGCTASKNAADVATPPVKTEDVKQPVTVAATEKKVEVAAQPNVETVKTVIEEKVADVKVEVKSEEVVGKSEAPAVKDEAAHSTETAVVPEVTVEDVEVQQPATEAPVENATTDEVIEVVTAPVIVGPPAAKKGTMSKQGHVVKNWKSRFFVLDNGVLTYFESSSPNPPFGVNEKGRIELKGCEIVLDDKSIFTLRKISQSTKSDGHDELVLDCKYPNERDEWIETIKSHIEYYSRQ